jgi:pimeloyl-ACP methyl ester carboxylesterase
MRSTFTTSDSVTLSFEDDDFTAPWHESETIVLLHPAFATSARFYGWVPTLAGRYRVLRLDARGHGRSETPPLHMEISLGRMARDVVELMDYLQISSAHVSGSSGGGYVAQKLAANFPTRVDRLALFSTTPGLTYNNLDIPAWCRKIRAYGVDGLFRDTMKQRVAGLGGAGYANWIAEDAAGMDREWACKFLQAMDEPGLADELKNIVAPTLVVDPGADELGMAHGYELLRTIPDSRYVQYEGLPHAISNLFPTRCAEELLTFLGGPDRRDETESAT